MPTTLFLSFIRIALFAALINAVAPTITYVAAASQGKEVVEICTSFGLKKIVVDTAPDAASPGKQPPDVRCQFCLASLDAVAFLLSPTLPQPATSEAASLAWLDQSLDSRRKIWPQGPPRAPPARTA